MTKPARSVLAGLAAGIAETLAMDAISVAWSFGRRRIFDGRERSLFHQGGRPDVERAKKLGKSSGDSESVITAKLAERIAEPILGRRLSDSERHYGGQIVHYGYGALLGAAYGLSGQRLGAVRSGHGTLFGAATWMGGVNIALPLLKLMKPPHKHSFGEHAFSLVSHLGYGLALQSVYTLLDHDLDSTGVNSMENTITRYLEDAIAAEKSFETQLTGFAKEATIPAVRALFETHAGETREQYQNLTARLTALGGSTSGFKSFLAHFFGASPKSAQMGHEPEERTVQDLMMAYSVENAEVAMYECLIVASEAAGDLETARLARRIQAQEQATADKLWPQIAPAAKEAFRQVVAKNSGNTREVLLSYLQDVEAAEQNFEDALASFSKMGDQQDVKELLSFMSRKARTQHERLQKRIESLGGSRSVTKSILAHMLAFTPTSAQIGHEGSEKNTQHLMITYAAAAAEMAMYESLAAVAESAVDHETVALARELQKEEKEDHTLAWRKLSASAEASFRDVVHRT